MWVTRRGFPESACTRHDFAWVQPTRPSTEKDKDGLGV